MSFQIGDPLFSHLGEPGVVVAPDKPGQLRVDQSSEAVRTEFRHGYIKGLAPDARQDFYKVMDELAAIEDPKEKIDALQSKITAAEGDTSLNARSILTYLKAELVHLMNSNHYTPRHYEIPPSRAP